MTQEQKELIRKECLYTLRFLNLPDKILNFLIDAHFTGYEIAEKHYAWHKASEGLPKDRRFFACRDFPHIEVLEYSERKNGYWNTKGSFFAEPEASQYFTHWMEVPEIKED